MQPHQWLKNWPLSQREARERPSRGSVKILAQVGEEVSLRFCRKHGGGWSGDLHCLSCGTLG